MKRVNIYKPHIEANQKTGQMEIVELKGELLKTISVMDSTYEHQPNENDEIFDEYVIHTQRWMELVDGEEDRKSVLMKMNRGEMNTFALSIGVEDPTSVNNKKSLADLIIEKEQENDRGNQ